MTKIREQVMFEDIANSVDALLYECLVDVPQTLGYKPIDVHDAIIVFIIDRIKQNHKRYIPEEEE